MNTYFVLGIEDTSIRKTYCARALVGLMLHINECFLDFHAVCKGNKQSAIIEYLRDTY